MEQPRSQSKIPICCLSNPESLLNSVKIMAFKGNLGRLGAKINIATVQNVVGETPIVIVGDNLDNIIMPHENMIWIATALISGLSSFQMVLFRLSFPPHYPASQAGSF